MRQVHLKCDRHLSHDMREISKHKNRKSSIINRLTPSDCRNVFCEEETQQDWYDLIYHSLWFECQILIHIWRKRKMNHWVYVTRNSTSLNRNSTRKSGKSRPRRLRLLSLWQSRERKRSERKVPPRRRHSGTGERAISASQSKKCLKSPSNNSNHNNRWCKARQNKTAEGIIGPLRTSITSRTSSRSSIRHSTMRPSSTRTKKWDTPNHRSYCRRRTRSRLRSGKAVSARETRRRWSLWKTTQNSSSSRNTNRVTPVGPRWNEQY